MAPLDKPTTMRPVARHHHSRGAQIGCPAHHGNDPRHARPVREGPRCGRLGDIGSRIVAEVFAGTMDGDALSFLHQTLDFEPGVFKSEASRVAAGT